MASITIDGQNIHSMNVNHDSGYMAILMVKPKPTETRPEPIHHAIYVAPEWTIMCCDNGDILIEM